MRKKKEKEIRGYSWMLSPREVEEIKYTKDADKYYKQKEEQRKRVQNINKRIKEERMRSTPLGAVIKTRDQFIPGKAKRHVRLAGKIPKNLL